MSDNPLETSPKRTAMIEARAKKMWTEAGSPEGGMAEFQERADELIRMEMAGQPGQLPIDPPSLIPGTVVDEASVQENLGEFPGRQADQGERRQTPMTREEMRKEEEAAK